MKSGNQPPAHVAILGSRGIPDRIGGFESLTERLAPFLVERGWQVTVACEEPGRGPVREGSWRGVRLLRVPMIAPGALGALLFDCRATTHALRLRPDVVLNLGYNTGFLNALIRLRGRPAVVNMDGIEWRREKWPLPIKAWFWLNEHLAARWSTRLIADHPVIADHLAGFVARDRITTIAYGADPPPEGDEPAAPSFGLEPHRFVIVVARLEPENSIREMVAAYCRRERGIPLAVIGPFEPDRSRYHRAIRDVAGPEVRLLGAVTDRARLARLRREAVLYLHGHRVGGTNPSLLEALAAGSPVLAHDNPFTRWVAGEGAAFFTNQDDCAAALDRLLGDPGCLERMRTASLARHAEAFRWAPHLEAYDRLLRSVVGAGARS